MRGRDRIGRMAPETEGESQTMPISAELLEILVCPETKQPVSQAPAEVIPKLATKPIAILLKGCSKVHSERKRKIVRNLYATDFPC